ncbi:hypothetical protein PVIIG_00677 [Plasmodium vivax India VII]|uniref:Selenoprotein n=2 Tax=Plasmodium vivax TaxID=5855 RepID=A5JZN0_PLAVS|nr:hypothetical protein, conserved [Plasmodium vivax]EDL47441.1 hypothetical protein, conserved [Plasmodium vivax]KMZ77990.1 hypothetical protein PVIIG_00677 [Plasmodium vivax India VII]|eukprot:XP_001617168.1 hypothetical protein [Plasmodium vivax Sal-1]
MVLNKVYLLTILLPNEDDDYLGKLINISKKITQYARNNKGKIAKVLATSALSAYSLNWVYQSGVTLQRDPHYSLFVPSNSYINSAIKRVKKNYQVKKYTFKEKKIFERNFHLNNAISQMGQMYVVNNLVNFLNFLPYKWRTKCTYNFCKYKEFENVENFFDYIKMVKHEGPILLFQGKLKKQYWIHLPLKYEILKPGDGSLCTLTFTPLHKYYSDYTVEIKLVKEKENNNVKLITSVKCNSKNGEEGNSFYINVVKNIAMLLTYDIFEGINNNIHVVYRRNASCGKSMFTRSNAILKRKKKTTLQFVLSPVSTPWSFKMRRS